MCHEIIAQRCRLSIEHLKFVAFDLFQLRCPIFLLLHSIVRRLLFIAFAFLTFLALAFVSIIVVFSLRRLLFFRRWPVVVRLFDPFHNFLDDRPMVRRSIFVDFWKNENWKEKKTSSRRRTERFSWPIDVFEELRRMTVVTEIVIRFQSPFEFQFGVVRARHDFLRQMHNPLAKIIVARLEHENEF